MSVCVCVGVINVPSLLIPIIGTRVVTHLEQGKIAVSHNRQSTYPETCHLGSRSWTGEALTAEWDSSLQRASSEQRCSELGIRYSQTE